MNTSHLYRTNNIDQDKSCVDDDGDDDESTIIHVSEEDDDDKWRGDTTGEGQQKRHSNRFIRSQEDVQLHQGHQQPQPEPSHRQHEHATATTHKNMTATTVYAFDKRLSSLNQVEGLSQCTALESLCLQMNSLDHIDFGETQLQSKQSLKLVNINEEGKSIEVNEASNHGLILSPSHRALFKWSNLFSTLVDVNLSCNDLSSVPAGLGYLRMLQKLNLSSNRITHLVPPASVVSVTASNPSAPSTPSHINKQASFKTSRGRSQSCSSSSASRNASRSGSASSNWRHHHASSAEDIDTLKNDHDNEIRIGERGGTFLDLLFGERSVLTHLDLSFNMIDQANIVELLSASQQERAHRHKHCQTHISSSTVAARSPILSASSPLTILDLSGNRLGSKCAAATKTATATNGPHRNKKVTQTSSARTKRSSTKEVDGRKSKVKDSKKEDDMVDTGNAAGKHAPGSPLADILRLINVMFPQLRLLSLKVVDPSSECDSVVPPHLENPIIRPFYFDEDVDQHDSDSVHYTDMDGNMKGVYEATGAQSRTDRLTQHTEIGVLKEGTDEGGVEMMMDVMDQIRRHPPQSLRLESYRRTASLCCPQLEVLDRFALRWSPSRPDCKIGEIVSVERLASLVESVSVLSTPLPCPTTTTPLPPSSSLPEEEKEKDLVSVSPSRVLSSRDEEVPEKKKSKKKVQIQSQQPPDKSVVEKLESKETVETALVEKDVMSEDKASAVSSLLSDGKTQSQQEKPETEPEQKQEPHTYTETITEMADLLQRYRDALVQAQEEASAARRVIQRLRGELRHLEWSVEEDQGAHKAVLAASERHAERQRVAMDEEIQRRAAENRTMAEQLARAEKQLVDLQGRRDQTVLQAVQRTEEDAGKQLRLEIDEIERGHKQALNAAMSFMQERCRKSIIETIQTTAKRLVSEFFEHRETVLRRMQEAEWVELYRQHLTGRHDIELRQQYHIIQQQVHERTETEQVAAMEHERRRIRSQLVSDFMEREQVLVQQQTVALERRLATELETERKQAERTHQDAVKHLKAELTSQHEQELRKEKEENEVNVRRLADSLSQTFAQKEAELIAHRNAEVTVTASEAVRRWLTDNALSTHEMLLSDYSDLLRDAFNTISDGLSHVRSEWDNCSRPSTCASVAVNTTISTTMNSSSRSRTCATTGAGAHDDEQVAAAMTGAATVDEKEMTVLVLNDAADEEEDKDISELVAADGTAATSPPSIPVPGVVTTVDAMQDAMRMNTEISEKKVKQKERARYDAKVATLKLKMQQYYGGIIEGAAKKERERTLNAKHRNLDAIVAVAIHRVKLWLNRTCSSSSDTPDGSDSHHHDPISPPPLLIALNPNHSSHPTTTASRSSPRQPTAEATTAAAATGGSLPPLPDQRSNSRSYSPPRAIHSAPQYIGPDEIDEYDGQVSIINSSGSDSEGAEVVDVRRRGAQRMHHDHRHLSHSTHEYVTRSKHLTSANTSSGHESSNNKLKSDSIDDERYRLKYVADALDRRLDTLLLGSESGSPVDSAATGSEVGVFQLLVAHVQRHYEDYARTVHNLKKSLKIKDAEIDDIDADAREKIDELRGRIATLSEDLKQSENESGFKNELTQFLAQQNLYLSAVFGLGVSRHTDSIEMEKPAPLSLYDMYMDRLCNLVCEYYTAVLAEQIAQHSSTVQHLRVHVEPLILELKHALRTVVREKTEAERKITELETMLGKERRNAASDAIQTVVENLRKTQIEMDI